MTTVYEYVQQQGLVEFGTATDQIKSFLGQAETILPGDSPAISAAIDLTHLNAAEITLLLEPSAFTHGEPLRVSEQASQLALSATNSGPTYGHDPREQPRLWDVTLLGSDASKLSWLGETDSVQIVADRFETIVHRLADLYARYPDIIDYGRRGVFALRAALWRSKMAVILGEEDLSAVSAAYASLTEAEAA
jgi:hypothetical protein